MAGDFLGGGGRRRRSTEATSSFFDVLSSGRQNTLFLMNFVRKCNKLCEGDGQM